MRDAITKFMDKYFEELKEFFIEESERLMSLSERMSLPYNNERVLVAFRAEGRTKKQVAMVEDLVRRQNAERNGLCDDEYYTVNGFFKKIKKDCDGKERKLRTRIEKKAGSVKKADLYLTDNGELNGHIVGDKGIVNIETIVASGPVQCPHYRTLVK